MLNELRKIGASDLVQSIESTVARGKSKTNVSKKTTQMSLLPKEAVIVALHMLVAAVEPPFQLKSAEEILDVKIDWAFDELQPQQFSSDSGIALFTQLVENELTPPKIPLLNEEERVALRDGVLRIIEMINELEKDLNADAS